MSVEARVYTTPEKDHYPHKNMHFMEQVKKHGELIAALSSGMLVLAAWSLEGRLNETMFVLFHLAAFIIGGYAKGKEGITATIEERKLNVEMLMILAAAGSALIGYWTEGAVLIFIFALSGALETYTLNKSQKEISSLMDLQPETALKITGGREVVVPVDRLHIGDLVKIKAGERVPADGTIVEGKTNIDESTITGESLPVPKQVDAEVFAGTVNQNGAILIAVTKKSGETLFQKIIDLVHTAQSEKSPSQLFIEKFEGSYVNVVLAIVASMMIFPPLLLGWPWQETVYRAMILLVVASPCALVASIMPATLSAISNSARKGVLFKGGIHLENLSQVKAVAFDKTGTLTNGTPVVTDVHLRDQNEEDTILSAIQAIEKQSNHPLAKAIVHYTEKQDIAMKEALNVNEISGKGITAHVDGRLWKVGKDFLPEPAQEYERWNTISNKLAEEGKTIVTILDEQGVAGLIGLKDTIRQETKQAIASLKKQGICTVMLTGDNEITAKAIAGEAGIDHYVANCMPDQKVKEMKQLKQRFGSVGMVGDGINDAPALAAADIGVAMGGGTDVALETADVVLMKNDLPRIAKAMDLSKRMNKVVKQNIVFSIAVILLLITGNFTQFLDLPLGVIGHEGSTILVILNGLRLLRG
ncbi:heavy metal translocating P-type ATPase [Sediminibacillus massiliensis]|uniref:heavy metal translocating P-type ATPase n=1 Tax=Sediminibacillus massiliensis TaxID=1926277 RepID=UPI0009884118